MKSLILPFLALMASSKVAAQSSTCPFNYPVNLNATESSNGLVFTVASTNAVTNNRALQLRTNPNLASGFFVGLDATSPVLLSNLADAAVESQARNLYNQLYSLGPTAYLNLRDEINGTDRYTVGFANASTWPGEVDREWYLSGGAPDGTYVLFHDEPLGVVNGFVLCVADHDLDPGPWYQLFYYTYSEIPADFPECEYVGIRTTVAATIYNGECDIGGFVAS
ncbi:hypothetical protein GGS24DRAFT_220827 [Hypoxylon argillaceum]|nr:hypothetical protein GGS24DRAFT_220827 [Hypoxylon argillaceum]KAI1156622.1 hypothetical protein F4825DRAFT_403438 [Nemania diffusa]